MVFWMGGGPCTSFWNVVCSVSIEPGVLGEPTAVRHPLVVTIRDSVGRSEALPHPLLSTLVQAFGELVFAGLFRRWLRAPPLIRYNMAMTTKEIALRTIGQLPEDASWEDIQERLNFVAGVRKGLRELDQGKGISHDKVTEESAEWLTK